MPSGREIKQKALESQLRLALTLAGVKWTFFQVVRHSPFIKSLDLLTDLAKIA